jgi:hypothetical protein
VSELSQLTFDNDTKTQFHKKLYNSELYSEFRELYYSFIKEYLFTLFPNESSLVIQKDPGFRVNSPENTALGIKDDESDDGPIGMHCDADYNHPPEEFNYIIALTDMVETNSLYIESSPGSNDFKNLIMNNNEFCYFWGNKCRHYNMKNKTGRSRVSIDFRVIPFSAYNNKNENKSVHGGRNFTIGDYFILLHK